MSDKASTKNHHYNDYYRDELYFLRQMGKEFASKNPLLCHHLTEEDSDPDVERLMEGFAFLTGRIRQKLDDELPELTHTMMGLLWPHYLKPIPSMAILEFEPKGSLRGTQHIPRIKTEVDSIAVESTDKTKTRCRFRTCYNTELLPLKVENASMEGQQLRIRFSILGGAEFSALGIRQIRLNLHGDIVDKCELYLLLCEHLRDIIVQAVGNEDPFQQLILEPSNLEPVGFHESEGLLPYSSNSFLGYRLLQEYFAFPDKFMFLDLTGLEWATGLGIEHEFEIIFRFSRRPDTSLNIAKDSIHVNCTPIVNLFPRYSDPIRVEHERTHYRVRPEGPNSQYYEVYSVDNVHGTVQGDSQRRVYEPFYSFRHGLDDRSSVYYHTRLHNSVEDVETTETFISFVTSDKSVVVPPAEIIHAQLTCMNRHLTDQLDPGKIKTPTSSSPEFATFGNITGATQAIYTPLDGSLHWNLISHLSLNHLSLTDVNALRGILGLYNLHWFRDYQLANANERRVEGIRGIRNERRDRLYQGAAIRGNEIYIDMQEDHFAGEGDMYLLGCVLDEFLALYADINSFTKLTVTGTNRRRVYRWPTRIGGQILL